MPKDFKLPKQTETHEYIFDRKTGEIIAEHTRSIDAGTEPDDDINSALLQSLANDSDRAVKDLDVLQAKARVTREVLRVDIKTRKVITERRSKPDRVFLPDSLGRP
jgi:hypothetical protein